MLRWLAAGNNSGRTWKQPTFGGFESSFPGYLGGLGNADNHVLVDKMKVWEKSGGLPLGRDFIWAHHGHRFALRLPDASGMKQYAGWDSKTPFNSGSSSRFTAVELSWAGENSTFNRASSVCRHRFLLTNGQGDSKPAQRNNISRGDETFRWDP